MSHFAKGFDPGDRPEESIATREVYARAEMAGEMPANKVVDLRHVPPSQTSGVHLAASEKRGVIERYVSKLLAIIRHNRKQDPTHPCSSLTFPRLLAQVAYHFKVHEWRKLAVSIDVIPSLSAYAAKCKQVDNAIHAIFATRDILTLYELQREVPAVCGVAGWEALDVLHSVAENPCAVLYYGASLPPALVCELPHVTSERVLAFLYSCETVAGTTLSDLLKSYAAAAAIKHPDFTPAAFQETPELMGVWVRSIGVLMELVDTEKRRINAVLERQKAKGQLSDDAVRMASWLARVVLSGAPNEAAQTNTLKGPTVRKVYLHTRSARPAEQALVTSTLRSLLYPAIDPNFDSENDYASSSASKESSDSSDSSDSSEEESTSDSEVQRPKRRRTSLAAALEKKVDLKEKKLRKRAARRNTAKRDEINEAILQNHLQRQAEAEAYKSLGIATREDVVSTIRSTLKELPVAEWHLPATYHRIQTSIEAAHTASVHAVSAKVGPLPSLILEAVQGVAVKGQITGKPFDSDKMQDIESESSDEESVLPEEERLALALGGVAKALPQAGEEWEDQGDAEEEEASDVVDELVRHTSMSLPLGTARRFVSFIANVERRCVEAVSSAASQTLPSFAHLRLGSFLDFIATHRADHCTLLQSAHLMYLKAAARIAKDQERLSPSHALHLIPLRTAEGEKAVECVSAVPGSLAGSMASFVVNVGLSDEADDRARESAGVVAGDVEGVLRRALLGGSCPESVWASEGAAHLKMLLEHMFPNIVHNEAVATAAVRAVAERLHTAHTTDTPRHILSFASICDDGFLRTIGITQPQLKPATLCFPSSDALVEHITTGLPLLCNIKAQLHWDTLFLPTYGELCAFLTQKNVNFLVDGSFHNVVCNGVRVASPEEVYAMGCGGDVAVRRFKAALEGGDVLTACHSLLSYVAEGRSGGADIQMFAECCAGVYRSFADEAQRVRVVIAAVAALPTSAVALFAHSVFVSPLILTTPSAISHILSHCPDVHSPQTLQLLHMLSSCGHASVVKLKIPSMLATPVETVAAPAVVSVAVPTSREEKEEKEEKVEKVVEKKAVPAVEGGVEGAPCSVVKQILRSEFGDGVELDDEGGKLLKTNLARLGRAIQRLASDLYSSDVHFVLELIQNADDNKYNLSGADVPTLCFDLTPSAVVISNNEVGFTSKNISALCDVGSSTKANTEGYIGMKGIGFKSVFRVTSCPEIHSNGFHINFDIDPKGNGNMGYIKPTWLGDEEDAGHPERLAVEERSTFGTQVVLPLLPELLDPRNRDALLEKVEDVHPSLLLFLRNLRRLVVRDHVNGMSRVMTRTDLSSTDASSDIIQVSNNEKVHTWLLKKRNFSSEIVRKDNRGHVATTELALAFPLDEVNGERDEMMVFAFLPLRACGLKFVLQGDWTIPTSREDIDSSSPWNQWLRSKVAPLFVESLESFKSYYGPDQHPKAVTNFLTYIPEGHGVFSFFKPVVSAVRTLLSRSTCLLTSEGEWVVPGDVIAVPDALAAQPCCISSVVAPQQLLLEAVGKRYLHPQIEIPDKILRHLGIGMFGVPELMDVLLRKVQAQRGDTAQYMQWLCRWILCLVTLFEGRCGASAVAPAYQAAVLEKLRTLPFIPTISSDTTVLTSLKQGVVFSSSSADASFEMDPRYDVFLAEMRLLNEDVLRLDTESPEEAAAAAVSVRRFFDRVGVRRLTPIDVVAQHVVPFYKKVVASKVDAATARLLRATLLFVAHHHHALPESLVKELAQHILVETNKGYVSPKATTVLFSTPYVACRANASEAVHNIGPERFYLKHFSTTRSTSCKDPSNFTVLSEIYSEMEQDTQHDEEDNNVLGMEGWVRLFRLFGVAWFFVPCVRRVQVRDHTKSAWQNVEWPFPTQGMDLNDAECPELQTALSSLIATYEEVKKAQAGCTDSFESASCLARLSAVLSCLTCIAEELDTHWDNTYHRFAAALPAGNVTQRASSARLPSSFALILRTLPWVPCTGNVLRRPSEILKRTPEVTRMLKGAVSCPLTNAIANEKMTVVMGIRTTIIPEDLVHALIKWSDSSMTRPFHSPVSDMNEIYTFLRKAAASGTLSDDCSGVLRNKAVLFVPRNGSAEVESTVAVRGVFLSASEVSWTDPIADLLRDRKEGRDPLRGLKGPQHTMNVVGQGSFHNRITTPCLQHCYGSAAEAENFFCRVVGVKKAHSFADYCTFMGLISEVALNTKASDGDAALVAIVGERRAGLHTSYGLQEVSEYAMASAERWSADLVQNADHFPSVQATYTALTKGLQAARLFEIHSPYEAAPSLHRVADGLLVNDLPPAIAHSVTLRLQANPPLPFVVIKPPPMLSLSKAIPALSQLYKATLLGDRAEVSVVANTVMWKETKRLHQLLIAALPYLQRYVTSKHPAVLKQLTPEKGVGSVSVRVVRGMVCKTTLRDEKSDTDYVFDSENAAVLAAQEVLHVRASHTGEYSDITTELLRHAGVTPRELSDKDDDFTVMLDFTHRVMLQIASGDEAGVEKYCLDHNVARLPTETPIWSMTTLPQAPSEVAPTKMFPSTSFNPSSAKPDQEYVPLDQAAEDRLMRLDEEVTAELKEEAKEAKEVATVDPNNANVRATLEEGNEENQEQQRKALEAKMLQTVASNVEKGEGGSAAGGNQSVLMSAALVPTDLRKYLQILRAWTADGRVQFVVLQRESITQKLGLQFQAQSLVIKGHTPDTPAAAKACELPVGFFVLACNGTPVRNMGELKVQLPRAANVVIGICPDGFPEDPEAYLAVNAIQPVPPRPKREHTDGILNAMDDTQNTQSKVSFAPSKPHTERKPQHTPRFSSGTPLFDSDGRKIGFIDDSGTLVPTEPQAPVTAPPFPPLPPGGGKGKGAKGGKGGKAGAVFCYACGEAGHRVAECPKVKAGEVEMGVHGKAQTQPQASSETVGDASKMFFSGGSDADPKQGDNNNTNTNTNLIGEKRKREDDGAGRPSGFGPGGEGGAEGGAEAGGGGGDDTLEAALQHGGPRFGIWGEQSDTKGKGGKNKFPRMEKGMGKGGGKKGEGKGDKGGKKGEFSRLKMEPSNKDAERAGKGRSATEDDGYAKIGRWGEQFVYQYLSRRAGRNTEYSWVNDEEETGASYDIVERRTDTNTGTVQVKYVEVKTTVSAVKMFFEVSHRELQFAQASGENYTIIRVFSAGTRDARIISINNPFAEIQKGSLLISGTLRMTMIPLHQQANKVIEAKQHSLRKV